MDGSITRRGLDAVHIDFEAGTRCRTGGARAVASARAWPSSSATSPSSTPTSCWPTPRRVAVDVFDELRLEVNIGQYLDLLGTVRGGGTRRRPTASAVYKSGKYTVERPLHLGAALAGRLDDLAPSLSAYGLPLGEAFQLRDDLLGAFGDEDLPGKPVGDDLREGKPTALVALARERASGEVAELLEHRFGRPDLTDDEIAAIQSAMVDTGAVAEVEAQIDSLVGDGLGSLEAAPLTAEAREHLVELAWFVAGRNH